MREQLLNSKVSGDDRSISVLAQRDSPAVDAVISMWPASEGPSGKPHQPKVCAFRQISVSGRNDSVAQHEVSDAADGS